MEQTQKFTTTVSVFFEAAHRLVDSPFLISKQCRNLHGHTYCVRCTFSAPVNARAGMVIDFKAVKDVLSQFDHTFINDEFNKHKGSTGVKGSKTWQKVPTTAENIAKFLHADLTAKYPDLEDVSIKLCEGFHGEKASQWVTYGT